MMMMMVPLLLPSRGPPALGRTDEIGLVGRHDDRHVGHVPGAVDLVSQGLDVLEGARAAHVIHQKVGGG